MPARPGFAAGRRPVTSTWRDWEATPVVTAVALGGVDDSRRGRDPARVIDDLQDALGVAGQGEGLVLVGRVGDEPAQDGRPVLVDLDGDPLGVEPLVLAKAGLDLLAQPEVADRGPTFRAAVADVGPRRTWPPWSRDARPNAGCRRIPRARRSDRPGRRTRRSGAGRRRARRRPTAASSGPGGASPLKSRGLGDPDRLGSSWSSIPLVSKACRRRGPRTTTRSRPLKQTDHARPGISSPDDCSPRKHPLNRICAQASWLLRQATSEGRGRQPEMARPNGTVRPIRRGSPAANRPAHDWGRVARDRGAPAASGGDLHVHVVISTQHRSGNPPSPTLRPGTGTRRGGAARGRWVAIHERDRRAAGWP